MTHYIEAFRSLFFYIIGFSIRNYGIGMHRSTPSGPWWKESSAILVGILGASVVIIVPVIIIHVIQKRVGKKEGWLSWLLDEQNSSETSEDRSKDNNNELTRSNKMVVRAEWFLYRGMQLVDDRQYKDAIFHLDIALNDYYGLGLLDCESDIAQAHLSRGFAYYGLDNTEQAIKDYTNALDIVPDSFTALCQRGLAYFTKGDCEKAIIDCKSALEIEPDNQVAKKLYILIVNPPTKNQ
jgi:tetratricopeptide (TPR) repeat protein